MAFRRLQDQAGVSRPGSARAGLALQIMGEGWRFGSGGFRFQNTWADELLPALDEFKPQLLLISAGFDAHMRDPLADLMLETQDFAWLTRQLRGLARRHAAGRVVSMLEGGYDLEALRECSAAHVDELR